MAFHNRDYKYENGIKILEHLQDPNKELPRSLQNITIEEKLNFLVYVISKKDKYSNELRDRLKEYQNIFFMMKKFIPHKGPTVYK
jgi:hypothetical protein